MVPEAEEGTEVPPLLVCPRCKSPLSRATAGALDHWACEECGGRAATYGRLRRVLPAEFLAQALAVPETPLRRGLLRCPLCLVHMAQLRVRHRGHEYALDRCSGCRLAWFDRGEHEAAEGRAPAPPPPDPVLDGPHRPFSYERTESEIDVDDHGFRGHPTDWLAALGLPVPDRHPHRGRPWAALVLSAAVGVVGVAVGLFGNPRLVEDFAMAAEDPFRHGGRDFLTSFFVHEDGWHLALSLYFLAVFGTWAEDILGAVRYLLLVTASSVAGGLLFAAISSDRRDLLLGADAGIAGVLAYGACAFPTARVRMMEFAHLALQPVSFSMTARAAFGAWILLHAAGALLLGWYGVWHFAPLGGAAVGALAWCLGAEGPWPLRKGPAGVPVP